MSISPHKVSRIAEINLLGHSGCRIPRITSGFNNGREDAVHGFSLAFLTVDRYIFKSSISVLTGDDRERKVV